jgi:hypothetical protein
MKKGSGMFLEVPIRSCGLENIIRISPNPARAGSNIKHQITENQSLAVSVADGVYVLPAGGVVAGVSGAVV